MRLCRRFQGCAHVCQGCTILTFKQHLYNPSKVFGSSSGISGNAFSPSSCCFSNFFPSFKNSFPRVALRFSRPRTERRGRSGKSPPPPLEARSRRHSLFPPPSVLRSPWRRPAARREGRSHSLGLLLTACLPRLL